MRIARFVHSGGMSFGAVEGEQGAGNAGMTVAEIEGHPFGDLTFSGARWALDDVRMLSPILPSKVVCVGRNYADHASEHGQRRAEGAAAVPQAIHVDHRRQRCDQAPGRSRSTSSTRRSWPW